MIKGLQARLTAPSTYNGGLNYPKVHKSMFHSSPKFSCRENLQSCVNAYLGSSASLELFLIHYSSKELSNTQHLHEYMQCAQRCFRDDHVI